MRARRRRVGQHSTWTNLLRVTRRGTVNLHRHLAPVEAWVLAGHWPYLEHDWTAGPGRFVYEPAGDVHTLTTVGEQEMITLARTGRSRTWRRRRPSSSVTWTSARRKTSGSPRS